MPSPRRDFVLAQSVQTGKGRTAAAREISAGANDFNDNKKSFFLNNISSAPPLDIVQTNLRDFPRQPFRALKKGSLLPLL
ncbi:MAG: hypothetical protein JW715_05225 [Sedimentisphaerales bacterium]|nr:hypothetical protein [Sedimentisphaerales bacterium]